MVNIDQKMKEFKSKPYDERLKISINIITNLKDRGNTQAQEIFGIISGMDKIPDNLIDAIYKDFCNSIEHIQKTKVQGQLHQFEEAKDYIQELRKREEQIRGEENADSLLASL